VGYGPRYIGGAAASRDGRAVVPFRLAATKGLFDAARAINPRTAQHRLAHRRGALA